MKRIKSLILLCLGIVFWSNTHAQIKYKRGGYIEVKVDGFTLSNPFLGGMNSPQFQMMDLNFDGKLDVIVFDRADNSLMAFTRISGEIFQPAMELVNQLPPGMSIYKLADLNSDQKLDVFTLAQTGELLIHVNTTKPGDKKLSFKSLGPQFYRNSNLDTTSPLLYNPLSFSGGKTDLPEIKDLDGDGDLDIVAYDPINATYFMFKDVRAEKKWSKDTFEFQNMDYCFGYFYETFDNKIKLNFCSGYREKLKPRHNGGAACWFFDNDDDGDFEMVIGNVGYKKITFLKNGKNDYQRYYDTMIAQDTLFPTGTSSFKGFAFPAGYMIDINGDSLSDMILAPNSLADPKETQNVYYYKNTGTKKGSSFQLQKTNFLIDKMLDLGARSAPAFLDVDGDGDLDMLVANNGDFDITKGIHDRLSLFTNKGTKFKPSYEFTKADFLNTKDSFFKNMIPAVGDIDNDGDQDILLGVMNSYDTIRGLFEARIVWYENKNNVFTCKTSNFLKDFQPTIFEFDLAPEVIDYNGDGYNDLMVGMYDGNISLFENTGHATLDFTRVSAKAYGMKANKWLSDIDPQDFESFGWAVPRAVDVDNDGKKEIVVGSYSGITRLYHIAGHSYTDSLIADENFFVEIVGSDTFQPIIGKRLTPAFADLNNDSIPEMFLGCVRGGLEMAVALHTKAFNEVHSVEKTKFKIFPNPTQSSFVIERSFCYDNIDVEVNGLTGANHVKTQIKANECSKGIDLKLAKGIYVVKISRSGEPLQQFKLVIQ